MLREWVIKWMIHLSPYYIWYYQIFYLSLINSSFRNMVWWLHHVHLNRTFEINNYHKLDLVMGFLSCMQASNDSVISTGDSAYVMLHLFMRHCAISWINCLFFSWFSYAVICRKGTTLRPIVWPICLLCFATLCTYISRSTFLLCR